RSRSCRILRRSRKKSDYRGRRRASAGLECTTFISKGIRRTTMTAKFSIANLLRSAAIVGVATASGFVAAHDVKIKLSGAEEVPPVTTSATGSGTIKIGDDGSVSGSVKIDGVDGVAAHIHQAPIGQSGPPIITLIKGEGGSWNVPAGSKLTPEQYEAFKAGNLYVNVHSAAHKPGEIRAQLKH